MALSPTNASVMSNGSGGLILVPTGAARRNSAAEDPHTHAHAAVAQAYPPGYGPATGGVRRSSNAGRISETSLPPNAPEYDEDGMYEDTHTHTHTHMRGHTQSGDFMSGPGEEEDLDPGGDLREGDEEDGVYEGVEDGRASGVKRVYWADENGLALYEVYYSDKLHYSPQYSFEENAPGGGCCTVM